MARSFVPLTAMRPGFLEHLFKEAKIIFLCPGDVLFQRGDQTARHFYLLSGQLENIFASGHSELIRAFEAVNPITEELPRPCTSVATTDATIISFDSDRLDCILSWSQIAEYLRGVLCAKRDLDEDIEWIETVLSSNLFYKVPPVNAERIISNTQPVVVGAGEVIIREGEIGDCCYFIKDGTAEVTRKEHDNTTLKLAQIGPGRCFGEDALVYETLRNATVTMTTDGVLMKLSKSDFKHLLTEPAIEEITEQGMSDVLEPIVMIDVRTQQEYEKGHLALAVNIPLHLLSVKQRLLREHIPYVLYCDTGRRSKAAAFLLAKQGYNTVALKGGLVGAQMQYQVVTDFSYVLRNGQVAKA